MRLVELDARFLRIVDATHRRVVDALTDADGVIFLCPKCYAANGGSVGTYSIICWKPGVAPEHLPGPARWPMTGASLADLTLSPSVLIIGGCAAHFFVRGGAIEMC